MILIMLKEQLSGPLTRENGGSSSAYRRLAMEESCAPLHER